TATTPNRPNSFGAVRRAELFGPAGPSRWWRQVGGLVEEEGAAFFGLNGSKVLGIVEELVYGNRWVDGVTLVHAKIRVGVRVTRTHFLQHLHDERRVDEQRLDRELHRVVGPPFLARLGVLLHQPRDPSLPPLLPRLVLRGHDLLFLGRGLRRRGD